MEICLPDQWVERFLAYHFNKKKNDFCLSWFSVSLSAAVTTMKFCLRYSVEPLINQYHQCWAHRNIQISFASGFVRIVWNWWKKKIQIKCKRPSLKRWHFQLQLKNCIINQKRFWLVKFSLNWIALIDFRLDNQQSNIINDVSYTASSNLRHHFKKTGRNDDRWER